MPQITSKRLVNRRSNKVVNIASTKMMKRLTTFCWFELRDHLAAPHPYVNCERNRSNPEALSLMPHSSGNPRFDWKTWMAGASPAMTKRDTVFQKQRT